MLASETFVCRKLFRILIPGRQGFYGFGKSRRLREKLEYFIDGHKTLTSIILMWLLMKTNEY